MKKITGYEEAQAITGEFETLEAGGYICRITNAKEDTSSTGKAMLVIAFDIEEGPRAGYYRRRYEADTRTDKKWQGTYRQMLEGEKAASFLKGLMTSIEASNPGFKWNWDETKLKGLKFGGIFGEEEYNWNGETKTSVKIKWIRSVDKVRNGDFKVPEPKRIAPTSSNPYAGTPFDDMTQVDANGDIPF